MCAAHQLYLIDLLIHQFVNAALAAKFKRDTSSASDKAFAGVLAFLFVAGSLKNKGVSIHKNSLASCHMASSYRRVTHSDVCFQTK